MSDLFVSCSYLGRQKWCQQVFEGFFSIWFEDKEEPKTIYDYEQLINEVNNCLRKQNGLETSTIEIIQMKQMRGGGR